MNKVTIDLGYYDELKSLEEALKKSTNTIQTPNGFYCRYENLNEEDLIKTQSEEIKQNRRKIRELVNEKYDLLNRNLWQRIINKF